mgnify:CR=1 FL=1
MGFLTHGINPLSQVIHERAQLLARHHVAFARMQKREEVGNLAHFACNAACSCHLTSCSLDAFRWQAPKYARPMQRKQRFYARCSTTHKLVCLKHSACVIPRALLETEIVAAWAAPADEVFIQKMLSLAGTLPEVRITASPYRVCRRLTCSYLITACFLAD